MSEAKHTPGPWEIRSSVPYDDGLTVFHGRWEKNVTVCRLWHSNREAQRANANLIAAAPELLEALKALLADIEDYQTINNLGGFGNSTQVQARAAIAKAEGQQ